MLLTHSDPVLDVESLADLMPVRLLDVRSAEDYLAARLPGAVRAPIEIWESAAKNPSTSLSNIAFWEAEIGKLGIDGKHPVLIYDDGRMTESARVWFILQHFGVDAKIINAGPRELQVLLDGTKEQGAPPSVPAVVFQASGSGQVGLVERPDMKDALLSAQVFDARTPPEFNGTDLKKNVRGGHLPAAVNLPHGVLLTETGNLKSAEALQELLLGYGFRPGARIVTHCDGGGRAALAALAAVRAGFQNVDAYYLSFSDWAKDESCPVVTSSKPE